MNGLEDLKCYWGSSTKKRLVVKDKIRLIWQRGELARNHSKLEFHGTNK
ncbi:hypothetical protein COLO4_33822 [Corchorus olitorius]|uniref:Uncharacterized protein n=1 Tax=Corchorus olitorius TaxID=93759 RepID=A0A1R3GQV1_9ROSI|nr:hypothetical protein COLO4_33822 [Corchorus olitorius]